MRLLRISQVIDKTSLSRSTIYELMRTGQFPKQLRISAKAAAWREDEIDAWIIGRTAA